LTCSESKVHRKRRKWREEVNELKIPGVKSTFKHGRPQKDFAREGEVPFEERIVQILDEGETL